MNFISTRGLEKDVQASEGIVRGIAKDGGLYVPEGFPKIFEEFKDNLNISYEDLGLKIIGSYFTDISKEDLKDAISKAYTNRFKVEVKNNFLELYHGPTSAFKDAALLFLPQIMEKAKKKLGKNEEIVILTATSGDTGKAALEGFASVDGFKVVVYYPKDGVSEIQRKQMVTTEGDNVKVFGIEGNFDDTQRGVKEIFGDEEFKKELLKENTILSSANSINIGRLVPQIVYYFYGYLKLVKEGKIAFGEEINVCVPTGNFGNILASYYAKQMGLPISKFICASNENKVLTDFFKKGIYDRRRELVLTESPSMDILVSSNLERLLFEASGRDASEVKKLMEALASKGVYEISDKMRDFLVDFYGDFATTEEVYRAINNKYKDENYLMDTHTAVGYVVWERYVKKTGDDKEVLIASTASPYKFPRSILKALKIDDSGLNDFEILSKLNEVSKVPVPNNLKKLKDMKVLHNDECLGSEMKEVLIKYLKEGK